MRKQNRHICMLLKILNTSRFKLTFRISGPQRRAEDSTQDNATLDKLNQAPATVCSPRSLSQFYSYFT